MQKEAKNLTRSVRFRPPPCCLLFRSSWHLSASNPDILTVNIHSNIFLFVTFHVSLVPPTQISPQGLYLARSGFIGKGSFPNVTRENGEGFLLCRRQSWNCITCQTVVPTGVTLIRAMENETAAAPRVKSSRAKRRPWKKEWNSSIRPVMTHSIPPICKEKRHSFKAKEMQWNVLMKQTAYNRNYKPKYCINSGLTSHSHVNKSF